MTALPLCVRAALWTTAALAGRVPRPDAQTRAHAGVTDVVGPLPGSARWPDPGEELVVVALPRPGSFSGMPRAGKAALAAALDAGECLVAPTVGGLLVPRIETFGPAGDQGRLLTWTAYEAAPVARHQLEQVELRGLARQLTDAVAQATRALTSVGGTPWQPSEPLGGPADPGAAILPRGVGERALRLLTQAATVHSLALQGWELEQALPALDAVTSQRRAAVLRELAECADATLVGVTAVASMTLAGWRPE